MKPKTLAWIASAAWIGLIVVCVAWEAWLAPLRPGGTWLMAKAVPLLVPLFGLLHGKRYTYQWGCMFVLIYFMEGVVRMNDGNGVALYARLEIALSVVAFVSMVLYARVTAPSRQKAEQK